MQMTRHVAALALGLIATLALGGCASELKKAKSELGVLADLLPGHYNNAVQVQEDVKAGRAPHPSLTLDIVRVPLPLLSDYVFYAQEGAAGEARRITSQRLYTFQAGKDGTIVQTMYTFAQPARWRDGHLNAGLFTGMMFKDTTAMSGCDLTWKKDGDKFTGANHRDTCRVSSGTLGTVRTDFKIELSGDELAVAELAYTVGGKLVQGNADEPFYRFTRGDAE